MRRFGGILTAFIALCVIGCNGPAPSVNLDDLASLTSDALLALLLGPTPQERAASATPLDNPLLEKGVYDSVVLTADAKEFAHLSHNALSEKRVAEIMRRITEEMNSRGRKRGFQFRQSSYPATITDDKTLLVTLTPTLNDISAVTDRDAVTDKNKERRPSKLLMARLTVTDPKTNAILAERLYYSGAEIGGGTRSEPLRYKKIR